jgi:hypothetical protein
MRQLGISEGPSCKTFYEHNLAIKKPDKTELAKPKSLTYSEGATRTDLKLQEDKETKSAYLCFTSMWRYKQTISLSRE